MPLIEQIIVVEQIIIIIETCKSKYYDRRVPAKSEEESKGFAERCG